MDNPNGSFDHYRVAASGTVVARDHATSLHVVLPEVSVGTVTLFDCDTAAGTTAENTIMSFTGGTAVQDCFPRTVNYRCRNGLVYAAVGTPVFVLGIA